MAKPATETPRLIADNRKARFDYFIEERYEAGLALQGWEVKAMRAGRAQLKEEYVYLRDGEACGGRHDRTEVARRFAVDQIARAIAQNRLRLLALGDPATPRLVRFREVARAIA